MKEKNLINDYEEYFLVREIFSLITKMLTAKLSTLKGSSKLNLLLDLIDNFNFNKEELEKQNKYFESAKETKRFYIITGIFIKEYFENENEWPKYSYGKKMMEGDELGYFLEIDFINENIEGKIVEYCKDDINQFSNSHVALDRILKIDVPEEILVLAKIKDYKKPKI